MPKAFNKWQAALLAALMSLSATASCLYSPALPAMAHSVERSIQALQFLIVANLLGHILGPLFYGVLANRYGRLHAIRVGLGLMMLGALWCIAAGHYASYTMLLGGGVVLTFGANVGLSLALTMVKDHTAETQRYNAWSLLGFAILPGVAVLLGSSMLRHTTWPWLFVVLIGYSVFLSLSLRILPETLRDKPARLLSFTTLSSRHFWGACVLLSCVTGCFYTFSAQIPRIALTVLHLDLLRFGLYSNIPSLGMLIGTIVAIAAATHISPAQSVRWGLGLAGVVVVLMGGYCAWFTPLALGVFIFIGLLNIGLQIIFPAAAALALRDSDNAASDAAWLAMINSGGAAIWVALGNLWPSDSVLSLPLCDGLILVIALGVMRHWIRVHQVKEVVP